MHVLKLLLCMKIYNHQCQHLFRENTFELKENIAYGPIITWGLKCLSIDILLLDQVCEIEILTNHYNNIIAFHDKNRREGSANHINILKPLYQTMLTSYYVTCTSTERGNWVLQWANRDRKRRCTKIITL